MGLLCQRQFGPFDWVVPCGGCGAGHVGDDGHIRVRSLGTLGVAAGELADQRDVHSTDERNGACLGRHGSHHADKVRALLFVEDDGFHVGRIDDSVDDHELGVGIIGRDVT